MTVRAIAACLSAASLVACATPSPEAPSRPVVMQAPSGEVPAAPEAIALPDAPALPRVVLVPGPPAESFVGQPLADIEALIGLPDLVRREGGTEFRRYDVTKDCRAYVIALPDGGTVLSVDTGAPVRGMRAPAFEDCTARETFTGS